MKQATLLFLLEDTRILLALKKRGFGVGKWNGVGGKPLPDETIAAAAVRECQEEIMVTPLIMQESAILNFHFPGDRQDWTQQAIVFVCTEWQDEPQETEEMAPQWFALDKLPYEKMWPDDQYWLPLVLKGEYVEAHFYFNAKEQLVSHTVALSHGIE